jgi:hypothetical protein
VTLETKKLAVVLQPMLAEQVVARPISLGSIFECIHELLGAYCLHCYRQLMGEELSSLGVTDLQGLENRLEMSLRSIKTRKVITCVLHYL